ncbi:MAG: proline dehydrogenase family protein [Actinomycetota bacterium]
MLDRALIWASERERIKDFVTQGKLAGVAHRFVAGDHLEDAIEAIKELNSKGIGGILDLLGEGVTDPAGARAASEAYHESIRRIDETGLDTTVSIKLTQLGLVFDKGTCIDYVRALAAAAERIGTRIEIDMEQSEHVVDTLDVYRLLSADFPDLRVAMQVYLRRTPVDLETLAPLKPRVRLVKGAYAEPEHLAFQRRKEIDAQYRFLTEWLFERGTDPGIATHDSALVEHAQRTAAAAGSGKNGFEIQMLYGIRRDYQEELARDGYRVRAYVPFGPDWYPYLMRRMAERPANLRFFLRALVGK